MENQTDLLQDVFVSKYKSRRELLPWWIKTFIWIFLVFAAIVPFGIVFGILGYSFQISLYGLETNDPLSITGLLLIFVYLFKGIVAFGLWTEKNWAVDLGIIDAFIGIGLCLIVMMVLPFINQESGFVLNFRIEIVLLILFLVKLRKIKKDWVQFF